MSKDSNVINADFGSKPDDEKDAIMKVMQYLGCCGSCIFRTESGICIGAPPGVVMAPKPSIITSGPPQSQLATARPQVKPEERACALHRHSREDQYTIELAMRNTFMPDSITTEDLMMIDSIKEANKK